MAKYQSVTIKHALEEIQGSHYLLPAFQRDFVWKHEQIEMLFDSLMQGYPIGGMLFWKLREDSGRKFRFYRMLSCYQENHKVRSDEVKVSLSRADFAVLDGQQRLTALNIGLCGTYAYKKNYARYALSENNYPTRRLYLDISRRYDDDEDGKAYRFEFLAGHEEDLFAEGDRLWLRAGVVVDLNYDARWQFTHDNNLTHEQTKILDRLWDLVWREEVISYYEEETDDPDVAVTVFARINSGGTRLNMSDILYAITIASWTKRDARNELASLVDTVNGMGFYISHDYVLKAFLYLFHTDIRFRIGSFDNEFTSLTEEKWQDVRDAILRTFKLVHGFGFNGSTLMSNYATLPILYHVYYLKDKASLNYDNERLIIKNWLLKSLLLRTFGYRSDGQLRKARQVLTEKAWPSFPAIYVENGLGQKVSDDEFLETVLSYQYDSRYALVVLSLLYSHYMMDGVKYEIDHIHPRALWTKEVGEWEQFNSIVNLQLLPDGKNGEKSDAPFEVWLDCELANRSVRREVLLRAALIPDLEDLSIGNFKAFYAARKELLKGKLRDLMRI